jgi:hypothetical protein
MARDRRIKQVARKSGIQEGRKTSPFDIQGVKTKAKTRDILQAVRESRER